ncbi:glycosyl hydrolases family 31-domain-containing protein [Tuber brumale]|nr:glycosyl hydrolases family 31-domain-containing protein [Tuber brumale]
MAPPVDSHSFLLPEEFFESFHQGKFTSSTRVTYHPEDNSPSNPVISTGVLLRLSTRNSGESEPLLLIQFVRPKVWRIRFDPNNTHPDDYDDYNSRAIISDTLTNLRNILDKVESIKWETEFVVGSETDQFYTLRSVLYGDEAEPRKRTTISELLIYKEFFKIQAVRCVSESGVADPPCPQGGQKAVHSQRKIVWETAGAGLSWKKTQKVAATVLTSKKPGLARYMGWGEQGGKELLKKSTLMNYFNFDNMTYSSVYGQGPLDEREPLYHSEPFWLELNGLPNYKSKVATFVDNYSQICVDFCVNHGGEINVGTRFGPLQYFVFAGDSVVEIIHLYSSIIGRARLKPRYVLGHHQGCYGYDTRNKVLKAAYGYVNNDIPLDGIHVDVDLQDDYRTFTIDSERRFARPKEMFHELRGLGIKSCTNITPVINLNPCDTYNTLHEGHKDGHFIMDKRYDDGTGVVPVHKVEYICYEGGIKLFIDPVNEKGQFPGAEYDFTRYYNNSNVAYRGGVGYGGTLGAPGHYPNLNNANTRKWWGEQYKYLFDQGLEFIWQDMTTPAIAKEYGDMKGLPFRLMVESDCWSGKDDSPKQMKPAIEIWSLYSYNLHKATYEGLNKLESRKNKRNFIIGRGSYAGANKWAGLWTGDNASTWDHLRISVNQVLALGISGNEIVGSDVGGFMPAGGRWAEPELLIRWYCAYSMLPWFRNHYHGKRGMKLFQEPYAFTDHFNSNPSGVPKKDRYLWLSVEPICRYYVKLRYSLLQLLYDAMFEHQFNGLPIARSLVITDSEDSSLLGEQDWVLDNEYMVRNDLLVCPVMHQQSVSGGHRSIYLPEPDGWYKFNLRVDNGRPRHDGVALEKRIPGGSKFEVGARIASEPAFLPIITPMFVREGGIIPQIEVRRHTDHIPGIANPIFIHLYPGRKTNSYRMFLDDGVSRDSAPNAYVDGEKVTVAYSSTDEGNPCFADVDTDLEAKNKFREIVFEQSFNLQERTRALTITVPRDNFDPIDYIGDVLTLVFWHEPNNSPVRDWEVRYEGYTGRQDHYHHEMCINTVVPLIGDLKMGQRVTITIGM